MSRKDVSDIQVCCAVELYNNLMRRQRSTGREIFGALPVYDAVPYPYEILSAVTGECEKVCFRAMERACDRGYIEYGVSLRTGWLTRKGAELIGLLSCD